MEHYCILTGEMMEESFNKVWHLVSITLQEWSDDHAAQLAAAIAYYTIFSIPALLIIAVDIAGYFYSPRAVQNQLVDQIGRVVGPQTADFIKSLVVNSTQSSNTIINTIISIVVLLFAASGVFNQIQIALNMIWDVPKPQGRALMRILKNHILSFLMVLAIGFFFLVFLAISAAVPVILGSMNVGVQQIPLVQVINYLIQFIILTVLIAMIYRVIPDKEISWADVWLGAAVTALLFLLGRYAIGLYLSFSKSASTYGAAGSLIVLLLWIYYSAQIFLLGAEFTQVYARQFGSNKVVNKNPAPNRTEAPVHQSQGLHPQE
jgi:membrane protein